MVVVVRLIVIVVRVMVIVVRLMVIVVRAKVEVRVMVLCTGSSMCTTSCYMEMYI